jgi:dipeptidyl aminopeptidase/acylaminoacyl peptidase
LYEVLNEPKALHILEGADHWFSASERREEAVRLTLEWFGRYRRSEVRDPQWNSAEAISRDK